jgi:hypothetical protein
MIMGSVPMIFLPLAPCPLPLKLEDVEHPKLKFFRFSGRVDVGRWTLYIPIGVK